MYTIVDESGFVITATQNKDELPEKQFEAVELLKE